MSKATIDGFATGTAVSLTASQSTGGSGSASIDSWGSANGGDPTPTGTVSINITRTTDRITPDPVTFEAITGGFTLPNRPSGSTQWRPVEHRLLFKWTFTSSGRTWDFFRSPFAEWEEHDVRYGKKVTQMVFDPNSDFTATVRVYGPGGEFAINSVTIPASQFVDPDVYFAGNGTVLVDPAGVGDSARYPGAIVVTNPNDVRDDGAYTNKRVLFKRGESFNISWDRYDTNGMTNFYFGAYGTGNRPALNWTLTMTNFPYMFLLRGLANVPRMVDLNIRGPWDIADLSDVSLNPTRPGSTFQGQLASLIELRTEQEAVVCGCRLSRNSQITTVDGNAGSHYIFWNTKITSWNDYGFFGGAPGGRLSFIGCDITQNPDSDSGGPKTSLTTGSQTYAATPSSELYAQHGPLRVDALGSMYLDCVSMGSYNGWFLNSGENYRDIQPCVRLTEVATGASIYMSRIMADGVIAFKNQQTSRTNTPLNAVLDKCVLLLTSSEGNGGTHLQVARSGVTVRNTLIISDDVGSFHRNDASPYDTLIEVEKYTNAVSVSTEFEPIEIYNCTVVDRLSTANNSANIAAISNDGFFNNVRVSGMIYHAPNKNTPVVPAAPMTEGAVLAAQSLWKGFAWKAGAFRHSLVNSINASQTTGIIAAGDEFLFRHSKQATGPHIAILGNSPGGEQISYTGVSNTGGNSEFTGVTRGVNGTTAQSHSAGSLRVWNGPVQRQSAFAATTDFAREWTPAAGSSALGGATSDAIKALDDIKGVLRHSVTAVDDGAFQVSS